MTFLADFLPLMPAEELLLEACKIGERATIGNGRLPIDKIDINIVRAEFIRFLALGGDANNIVHTHGVLVQGCWVVGILDLLYCKIKTNIDINHAHFDSDINCMNSIFYQNFILDGSTINKFLADGTRFEKNLYIRNANCNGEIRLLGCYIQNNLSFAKSTLNSFNNSYCISADGIEVNGGVFLKNIKSYGEVRFLSAKIKNGLEIDGAQLSVNKGSCLKLSNSYIEGNLYFRQNFIHQGKILLTNCTVTGTLCVLNNSRRISSIDLSSAYIGYIQDDLSSWGTNINLDGLVYTAFIEEKTANFRLAWLKTQSTADYGSKADISQFKPQPWQQLISVLRKTGHKAAADEIAIERENHMRQIGLISGAGAGLHWVFGKIAGYGYKPMRLVICLLAVWLACGMAFWELAKQGTFAPSNPLVFQSKAYADCSPTNSSGKFDRSLIDNDKVGGATRNWFTCGSLQGEYTTFSPLAYSLDVILPLVDLGQEKDWSVFIDTPKGNPAHELVHFSWNHFARLLVWFEILFGWIASLLLVAVLTGKTQRDAE